MAPPPMPELLDDAIAEILLRVPPSDPARIARASAVCKSWRRVLSDPVFPARYRAFHHKTPPPLLGFLRSSRRDTAMFVPIETRAPFLESTFRRCEPLECRHGRVLLDAVGGKRGTLAVWDPITGDHELLPEPGGGEESCSSRSRSGAVLCAAAAAAATTVTATGRPYRVVFEGNTDDTVDRVARAWVYSSEAAEWTTPSATLHLDAYSSIERKRAAIVGNEVYFLLSIRMGTRIAILKCDLGKHRLSVTRSPLEHSRDVVLMSMEDGSLGLAGVTGSTLELWSRKVDPEGVANWVQYRVIELLNLLRIDRPYHRASVIGFAEGVGVLLVGVDASTFMCELRSGQLRRLSKPGHYNDVFPFTRFYVPDFTSSPQIAIPSGDKLIATEP